MVTGCSSSKLQPTKENFQAALNTYYATRGECLFPNALSFPFEVSPGADAKGDKMRMDALMNAALVKREADKSINVYVYSLTPAGERAGARFCFGHRQITSIDSFTPPAKANGFLETQVSYHFSMTEVPVWAKTEEMQAAFPDLAKALSGNATGQTTLANAGVGWQVPG